MTSTKIEEHVQRNNSGMNQSQLFLVFLSAV